MQITLVKQERKMGQKKKKSLHVRVYIYIPLDVCWLFLSS